MPTTKTILFPPPLRGAELPEPIQKYLFTIQNMAPLLIVDTSAGPYAESLPPAGLNSTTGQSNQNQEITYIKSSADANVFTLNGAQGGPYTLTARYSLMKFKSDGTVWWKSG